MRTFLDRILYWTPRALGIILAAFISIFALDVFSEHSGFWQTASALAMHLVPTALIVAALIVAWRWELTGGFLLVALAVASVIVFSNTAAHLILTLPLAVMGMFGSCATPPRFSAM